MDIDTIEELSNRIKQEKPLVHLISNSVTRNDCANVVLAIGASPIMAIDPREVEEVVSKAKALVLNIGTIEKDIAESMILAGKKANSLNIPVVLDPVGVGISELRQNVVREILENVRIAIIKGNQAEIKILYGLRANFKGVDSEDNESIEFMTEISQVLSKETNSVVAVTGKVDVISSLDETIYLYNGHEMLRSITGTGCMGTALVGVFSSVTDSMLNAAVAGIYSLNRAGEIAYEKTKSFGGGSGSFKANLIDAIYKTYEKQ